MYAYLDRPVAGLAPDDHFLLDAMRGWALSTTMGGDPGRVLSRRHPRLAECGAVEAIDAAMRVLDAGSGEPMEFQRPCHATVEEQEAILLAIVALIRDGRMTAAAGALAGLVDHASAIRFVAMMADANRRILPAMTRPY